MKPAGLLRIGIVGTDTSHVTGFARLLNPESARPELVGARVVAAVPTFSEDIPSSLSRHEGFTGELVETLGVRLVDSIGELC